jgi:RING finger and CHY zinc finger domain-containing protein 1
MTECKHYDCSVDIQAYCCKEYFGCRICHDTVKNEEEKDPKKRHAIDRYLIELVKCRQCLTEQPPEQYCSNCGNCFGRYFCKVCRLYENNLSKNIYHCEACRICRIGPQENFYHCIGCDTCLSVAIKDSHTCRANATKINCAICQENLFYSRIQSISMKCGHFIHNSCYKEMVKNHHYNCPLCLKLAVDMPEEFIENLDKEIAATPMPEEYREVLVDILCNQCNAKSQVLFHIFGLKCPSCGHYNTSRC